MKLKLADDEHAATIWRLTKQWLENGGDIMFESTSIPKYAVAEYIANQSGLTLYKEKEGLEI